MLRARHPLHLVLLGCPGVQIQQARLLRIDEAERAQVRVEARARHEQAVAVHQVALPGHADLGAPGEPVELLRRIQPEAQGRDHHRRRAPGRTQRRAGQLGRQPDGVGPGRIRKHERGAVRTRHDGLTGPELVPQHRLADERGAGADGFRDVARDVAAAGAEQLVAGIAVRLGDGHEAPVERLHFRAALGVLVGAGAGALANRVDQRAHLRVPGDRVDRPLLLGQPQRQHRLDGVRVAHQLLGQRLLRGPVDEVHRRGTADHQHQQRRNGCVDEPQTRCSHGNLRSISDLACSHWSYSYCA